MTQHEEIGLVKEMSEMRSSYENETNTFTEKDLVAMDPILQFKNWYEAARHTPSIMEPNAMCLATCTSDGIPSARMVLLKDFGKDGFKFFSNYASRKGQELNENPRAALAFYWDRLYRSVRIEGHVEILSEQESTEYFHRRPRDSQLSASISNQSQPISGRKVLSDEFDTLQMKYMDEAIEIPKPHCWGGYKVVPEKIEFWQGQTSRLHDRIRFRRPKADEFADNKLLHQGSDGWVYERLAP